MAMYNYAPNAYGYYEDDEERRRKEQEQAQGFGAIEPIAPLAIEPVESQPIKQTITYDPVTGEQRMKIEGSVQDLSPANPMTPTVSMPGQQPAAEPVREMVQPTDLVPEQQPVQQPQQLPPGVQMVNGRLQLAPTTPVSPMTQAQSEMPAQEPAMAPMPQLPQPGPAVQVAGPAQMPPAAQPAPVAQPASADPLDVFSAASGNTANLLQIYNDKTQSPELRRLAGREASRMLESETRRAEAEKEVQGMDQNQLAKLLTSKSEEGSWGKRVLFGLLNMQGAMAAEDAKLGIGAKWSSTQLDDGSRVLVKMRADGLPMEGYNAATGEKLKAKELAGVGIGGKIDIVGGTYVNDRTGEVGRVVSDQKTGQSYVQTDTGRKPMTGFRPQASAGTLGDMNTRQLQELRNKLDFAGPTASAAEREKIIAESEARFGPLPEAYKAQVRGAAPQPTATQAQPAAVATAQPAAQTQPTATQAQPAAAPSGGRAGAPAVAGPVAPSVSMPGGAAGVAGTPAARESAAATNRAATEAAIQQRKELAVAEQKPAAIARGTDAATTVKNQAFADRSYDLFRPINDAIVKSTGSSIGAGVDTLAAAFGKSTKGSEAISRLNVLSYNILANIPRFEGPQSDIDVQMYKQAAGDFNNRKLPVEDRLAALDALRTILQRYDTAGRNDWNFGVGSAPAAGGIRVIKREKVQ